MRLGQGELLVSYRHLSTILTVIASIQISCRYYCQTRSTLTFDNSFNDKEFSLYHITNRIKTGFPQKSKYCASQVVSLIAELEMLKNITKKWEDRISFSMIHIQPYCRATFISFSAIKKYSHSLGKIFLLKTSVKHQVPTLQ